MRSSGAQERAKSPKRCKIGPRLLLRTNRKSHTRFRLVPTSMTLDDLERLKRLSCRNKRNLWAHQKNFNEDRPILSAAKLKHKVYMRIFAGRGRQIQYMLSYTCVQIIPCVLCVAYLQSWCALRSSVCLSQCTTGVDCTWLYPEDAYQGQ